MEKIKNIFKKSSLYFLIRKNLYGTSESDYNNNVETKNVTNLLIKNLILNNTSMMISRLGSNELYIIKRYLNKQSYPEQKKLILQNAAGVYPPTDATMNKFAETYLEAITYIDLLGIWYNPYEDVIANTICPAAKLTNLRNLEPYFSNTPWSQYLAGKKVLVIHPFSKSISLQYKKRELLFENKNILPEFELNTYTTIQSIGGNAHYRSWFDALNFMKEDISSIDFEIAIIGAGAYGLPLAAHIKQMGKKAIHMGGATQMLFGVYGKRWESKPEHKKLINAHWVKPSKEETPAEAKNVENACYW